MNGRKQTFGTIWAITFFLANKRHVTSWQKQRNDWCFRSQSHYTLLIGGTFCGLTFSIRNRYLEIELLEIWSTVFDVASQVGRLNVLLQKKRIGVRLTVPSRSILKKWMSRGTVPIRGLSRQVGLQICKLILMEHMSHCRKFLQ